jgi:hypothetical protein
MISFPRRSMAWKTASTELTNEKKTPMRAFIKSESVEAIVAAMMFEWNFEFTQLLLNTRKRLHNLIRRHAGII